MLLTTAYRRRVRLPRGGGDCKMGAAATITMTVMTSTVPTLVKCCNHNDYIRNHKRLAEGVGTSGLSARRHDLAHDVHHIVGDARRPMAGKQILQLTSAPASCEQQL